MRRFRRHQIVAGAGQRKAGAVRIALYRGDHRLRPGDHLAHERHPATPQTRPALPHCGLGPTAHIGAGGEILATALEQDGAHRCVTIKLDKRGYQSVTHSLRKRVQLRWIIERQDRQRSIARLQQRF